MKLINNRFKIIKIINKGSKNEGYIVEDLKDNNKLKYLRMYFWNKDKLTIEYLIDNYLDIRQIKHKNLVESLHFHIVDTINLKKISMPIYYTINEYINAPSLSDINMDLNLEDKVKLVLEIMSVTDYLHFRGFIYKYLNPANILFSQDKEMKIRGLTSIIDEGIRTNYDDIGEYFIAPEIFTKSDIIDKKADYYSLGIIIKYLFFHEFKESKFGIKDFKKELNLTIEQKTFLLKLVENLTYKDPKKRNVDLRKHIIDISEKFHLPYSYDLFQERGRLVSNTHLVGRQAEINRVLEIDQELIIGQRDYDAILVIGESGVGKSKFLSECRYKLRMLNRQVYFARGDKEDISGDISISNLLTKSLQYDNSSIINKYKMDFLYFLPGFEDEVVDNKKDVLLSKERYRVYNRIANYFSELSRDEYIYIVIDELQNAQEGFMTFLNYLMSNLVHSKIIFVLSTLDPSLIGNSIIETNIKRWLNSPNILKIELKNFNISDTEKVIKSMLGTKFVSKDLLSFIYKESQGNYKKIDYILKNLYTKDELFINESGNWSLKCGEYLDTYILSDTKESLKLQLNKITGNSLEILKVLSIFNSIFSEKIVWEIVNIKLDEYLKSLDELVEKEILKKTRADWGNNYRFFITDFKEVVYDSLDVKEKLTLHKKAADIMLELYEDGINLVFDELIHHLIKSNNYRLALKITLNKAKKQEKIHDKDSIILWELAYSIINGLSKEYNEKDKLDYLIILDMLTKIYLLKGNIKKAEYYLDQLSYISKEQKYAKYSTRSKYYRAEIYFTRNQIDKVEELLAGLEIDIKDNNIIEGKILFLLIKSKLEIKGQVLEDTESWLQEAELLSKKHNIKKYLGNIYNLLGVYYHLNKNPINAIHNFNKCINYTIGSNNLSETVKAINNVGNIHTTVYGDDVRALSQFKHGYKLSNKYGLAQGSIIFSNNIGTIYLGNLNFKEALKYYEDANRMAIEIEEFRGVFATSIGLAKAYLYSGDYEKMYSLYLFLKNTFEECKIDDIEVKSNYFEFISDFYGLIGKWSEALKYSNMASELYEKYSRINFLKVNSKSLYYRFFHEKYYNKEEILNVIKEYLKSRTNNFILIQILSFCLVAIENNDISFLEKLIDLYDSLDKGTDPPLVLGLRNIVDIHLDSSINNLKKIEREMENLDLHFLNIDLAYHYSIGIKWFEEGNYKKAIKHFLKLQDHMCKRLESIDDDLKYTFIKSRKNDKVKEYLYEAIKLEFNKELDYIRLDDIEDGRFNDYFDLNMVMELLDCKDFYKLTNIYNFESKVTDIEDLLYRMTNKFESNLDLILSFIKRETLAQRAYIITLDHESDKYNILAKSDEGHEFVLNENLIMASERSKKGILINKSFKNIKKTRYIDFLCGELVGIICIPITFNNRTNINTEKRKYKNPNIENKGYIYLDTESYINRFNFEKFKLVGSLSSLLCLNIENHLLKHMTTTDKLTNVLSRKYFEAQLDSLIDKYNRYQGNFSLLMLDIDNFKVINDNYGHLKGDEVLSLVGNEVKSSIRITDLVGRYGGEEFIVILFDTSIKEGIKVAEKIRHNIEKLSIPNIDRNLTASIGLAQYPEHGQFKNELIEKADKALYYVKEKLGKNKAIPWTLDIERHVDSTNKLSGICTGDMEIDSRNASAIGDVVDLTKKNLLIEDKIYDFLGILRNILEAKSISLIMINNNEISSTFTRARNKIEWGNIPKFNLSILKEVLENKKSKLLIDWENYEDVDPITGAPDWQSVMFIPLIKNNTIKAIIYATVSLKEKEFDFNSLNLIELISNIFVANL